MTAHVSQWPSVGVVLVVVDGNVVIALNTIHEHIRHKSKEDIK
jgi:hypothetical protein